MSSLRLLNLAKSRVFTPLFSQVRNVQSYNNHIHFKVSGRVHPLIATKDRLGDHTGRQQNHIWSREELDEKMATLYRHVPKTISDHIMNKFVRFVFLYTLFCFVKNNIFLFQLDVWSVLHI